MQAMKSDYHEEKVDLNLINYKMEELKLNFNDLRLQISTSAVGRVEFELRVGRIEKLVYGMVSFILVTVLSAIVYSVIKR